MATKNRIGYTVEFNVDKAGLSEVTKQLNAIEQKAKEMSKLGGVDEELKKASKDAETLKDILTRSWNSKLNQLDINKVDNELKKTGLTANQLKANLTAIGPAGSAAFNQFASTILNANMQLKQSSKLLDDMATTFKNTVRYGISSSIFNNLSNSIQKAFNYTKALDTSLNDIRIVTDKSAESMEKFAISANKVAKDLGKSTKDFTEAALIYYQQGLGDEESQARAEVTLKAANVTGQASREVSEQLTAIWNGYKVTAEEAELYIDKVAAVAAGTAADLEELSTGMSKVASAANIMGVDIDQLNAQLATIVSATRQAPESVGVALKTIYARMSDIKSGLDDETTLGNYTEKMAQYGINVLDANGKLRDMGEVIEEIGSKWENLSREQQVALSQIMAGTRQYNNLLSLFDNWDKYQKALKMSEDAAGTLQHQQEIYMESTEAHLQQMRTEAERTYDILFDTDTVNGFADSLTNMLSVFNNFLEGLGGGVNAIAFFGTTIANIFNKQIGSAIERQIENIESLKANRDAFKWKEELAASILTEHQAKGEFVGASAVEAEAEMAKKILSVKSVLTDEEYNQLTVMQQKLGLEAQRLEDLKNYKSISKEIFNNEEASKELYIKAIADEDKKLISINEQYNRSKELLRLNAAGQELDEEQKKSLAARVNLSSTYLKNVKEINQKEIENGKLTEKQIANLEEQNRKIEEQQSLLATGVEKIYNDPNKLNEKEIGAITSANETLYAKETEKLNQLKSGLNGVTLAQQGYTAATQESVVANQQATMDAEIANKERQQTISQGIQGLTSMISLAISLSGVFKTLSNDALSDSEKLERIIPVLLMAVPQLLTAFESIGSIIPMLSIEFEIFGNQVAALATKIVGVEVAVAPALLALAALALAIGLVVAAIVDAKKRAEAGEREIRALKKAVEEFKQAAEETRKTIDEIQSAFDKYDEILKTLAKCKEGTEEWTEALENANDYVIELLQKYPQLAQMDNLFKQENGYLTYNKDILKDYINQLKQEERVQMAAAVQTQSRANQRKIDDDVSKFTYKAGLNYYMNNIKNVHEAQPIGDQYIKQLAQVAATSTDSDWYAKEVGKIRDDMIKTNKATKESANQWYKMMLDHEEYKDNLRTLGKNIKTVNKTVENTSKVLAAELLGKDANAINTNILAEQIEKAKKEKTTKFTDVGATAGKGSKTYQDAVTLMNGGEENGRYQAAPESNVIQGGKGGTGGARQYYFYDTQTGETIKKSGTYLNQLYESQHLLDEIDVEEIKLKTDVIVGSFSKLSDLDKESSVQMLSKNFDVNLLTPDQYKKLQEQKDKIYDLLKPGDENVKMVDEDTFKYLTENADKFIIKDYSQIGSEAGVGFKESLKQQFISEEDWKLMGYESFDDWWKGFEEELENYDANIAAENLKKKFDQAIAAQSEKMKDTYNLDEKDFEDYAHHLSDIAKEEKKVSDTTENNAEATTVLARSIMRMNKGIDSLANNWENWGSILKKSSKWSEEYAEAIAGTREALGDLLDVDKELQNYFDDDFITKYADKIKEASKGSAEAIDFLRAKFADKVILDIATKEGWDSELTTEIQSKMKTLQDQLNGLSLGDINSESFIQSCQEIIDAAGLTKEQANKMFAAMGVEATYKTDEQPTTYSVPVYTTYVRTHKTRDEDTGLIEKDWEPQQETMTVQTGTETVTGEYATFAVATSTPDGQGSKTPQISGMIKKGTGSSNNYSSANKGGTAKPGGKSGGSGKKKGGGSKKDPDKMDPIKNEEDRYHQVDVQLQLIENDLEKLERAKEKAFGIDKISLLNKELAKYDDQIKRLNEKIKIAQGETDELRKKLAKQGVKFGADGTVSNYMAAIQAQENSVNAVINKYNKMSATAQEKYKKTVEKEKENFEEFKKNIDRYDDLISSTIPDLYDNIQDAIDKQIDIQIEEFDMEIEIRLDLTDAKKDWNQFRREVLKDFNDKAYKSSSPMGDLFEDSENLKDFFESGLINNLGRQLEGTLQELKVIDEGLTSSVYGDDKVKALEDLKNYLDESISALEEIEELENNIHEDFISNMDDIQDKFDEQLEYYETISKLLDHDKEVIELVSGDDAYKQLARFYDEQEDNYKKQLEFQKSQVDFWHNQLDILEKYPDELDDAKKKWEEAVQNYNDLIEDSIENLQDKYLNTIKDIFNDLNNRLSGGRGLEGMNDQWQLLNMQSEEYLDNVNGIYKTQELANKYLDAIDNTNNIKAQQRLKDIMDDELANLRSRDKLSEYDLQRAELRYQIAVKQIALEEAQQNKSKMRLRRDTQGNYRYEYVADDDQLNKTKQEISDFYNQLYNLDAKKYSENLEKVYNLTKEAEEKIQELYEDTTLTNEERQERILEITQYYGELIDQLTADNEYIKLNLQESTMSELFDLYDINKDNYAEMTNQQQEILNTYLKNSEDLTNAAYDNLFNIYNENIENFKNMTDAEIDNLMNELIPGWDSAYQQMIDSLNSEGGFVPATKQAYEDCGVAAEEYYAKIIELSKQSNDANEIAVATVNKRKTAEEEVLGVIQKEMDDGIKYLEYLENLKKAREADAAAAEKQTIAAQKYWEEQQRQAAEAAKKEADKKKEEAAKKAETSKTTNNTTTKTSTSSSSSSKSSSSGGDGKLSVGDKATYTGKYYYDSKGTAPAGSRYSGVKNGIIVDRINNNAYGVHIKSADGKYGDLGWVKKSQLSGYDTGGYTGTWGNDGRLALLHQKELVLNSTDTKNMLNAVKIIRQITDTLGANILNRLADIGSAGMGNIVTGNGTLAQKVDIQASFPNVTNHNEIEEALNNLVNAAAQRVNLN